MEEEKSFNFAGFGLPTQSCLVCFHMMTSKQTDNLNRTVRVFKNLLIYRAPPTVHFHRTVHSLKEGRFLIENICVLSV